jgi:mannose-6-phosphate isomerase-like protein (cupin superfamily)
MAQGLASVVTAESVPLLAGMARRYERLLATDDYEVWLIAWAAAGVLELHDHGGSIAVMCVVEGELVETYTDLVDRHPLRSVTVGAGQSLALPVTRVHEVWNPGPAPALSVHAYSPPLRTMRFFDHRPEHFLARLRTERAELAR